MPFFVMKFYETNFTMVEYSTEFFSIFLIYAMINRLEKRAFTKNTSKKYNK